MVATLAAPCRVAAGPRPARCPARAEAGRTGSSIRPASPALRLAPLAPSLRRRSVKATRSPAAARAAAAAAPAAAAGGMTLTQIIAVIIGYCVLAGSCVRSLPQIIKIVRARSVTGLSLAANAAELVAYSITFAYNFRLGYGFSTYGELVSCWAQDIVLVCLLLHYGPGLSRRAAAGAAAYGALLWAFMSGAVPMPLLTALQASTIFIVALGGRVPQILLNRRRGDSGQLSLLTSALNLAGNIARVFTTVVLTGDGLNLAGALVQGVLNSILLAQCWGTLRRRKKGAAGEGAGAAAASPRPEGATPADGAEEAVDGGGGEEPAVPAPPLPVRPPSPPTPTPAIVPGLAGA